MSNMAKLMKCPSCGHEIDPNADSCPNCGWKNDLNPEEKATAVKKAGRENGILATVCLISFILFGLFLAILL